MIAEARPAVMPAELSGPENSARRFEAQGRGCGKAILLGEHAVVYGVPALAVGLERGAIAARVPIADGATACSLHVAEWNLRVSEGESELLAVAFTRLLAATRRESATLAQGAVVAIEAMADVPPGGGLGCSAAVGVAVARALDPLASAAVIEQRVMAWEGVFHGNPSGVDAAVSTHGGALQFERGRGIEFLRLRKPMHLAVGHSGVPSSTKAMVDAVARELQRRPNIVEKAWDGIRALSANGKLCLEGGDYAALGQLMDLNQMILGGLLLSTPELEELCQIARKGGAFGAKLTGAGGGGAALALAPSADIAASITAAWKVAGYTGFATVVQPSKWRAELAFDRTSDSAREPGL